MGDTASSPVPSKPPPQATGWRQRVASQGFTVGLARDLSGPSAEEAHRRADQRDDPVAPLNPGGLFEQLGDLAGAETAYRRADERGDANGPFNLGGLGLFGRRDRRDASDPTVPESVPCRWRSRWAPILHLRRPLPRRLRPRRIHFGWIRESGAPRRTESNIDHRNPGLMPRTLATATVDRLLHHPHVINHRRPRQLPARASDRWQRSDAPTLIATGAGRGRGRRGWARSSCRSPSKRSGGAYFPSFSGAAAAVRAGDCGGGDGGLRERGLDQESRPACRAARDSRADQGRVSALCRALDDQVEAFRNRPLAGAHPYMWLDVKARHEALLVRVGC